MMSLFEKQQAEENQFSYLILKYFLVFQLTDCFSSGSDKKKIPSCKLLNIFLLLIMN